MQMAAYYQEVQTTCSSGGGLLSACFAFCASAACFTLFFHGSVIFYLKSFYSCSLKSFATDNTIGETVDLETSIFHTGRLLSQVL